MKSIAYYPVCLDGNGAPSHSIWSILWKTEGICSKPGDKIRLLPGNIQKIVKGNNGNREATIQC